MAERSGSMVRRLKEALTAGALLLLSVTIFLFILEVVVATFYQQPIPMKGFYVADKDAIFRVAPNLDVRMVSRERTYTVNTNSTGFRSSEIDRTHTTRKILFLGDSFTFGFNVAGEDTFVARTEALLNEESRSDPKYQCINSGVPGYGTFHQLKILETFPPDIRLRGVIVVFYIGNDILDNIIVDRRIVKDGYLVNRFSDTSGIIPYLSVSSHLYRLVSVRIKRLLQKIGMGDRIPGVGRENYRVSRIFKANFGLESPALRATFDYLLRTRDFCNERGVPLGLALIPTPYQLNDEIFEKALRFSGFKREDYNRIRVNEILADFLRSNKIAFVDLLPALEKAENPTYFAIDRHFNETGHEIAAKMIYERLLPGMMGIRR